MKMKLYVLVIVVFLFNSCRKNREFVNADNIKYPLTKSVGYSANDLLSDSRCTSLRVEIQYMAGFEPDAQALDLLKDFLNSRLKKPHGIFFVKKEIPAAGQGSYSLDDIQNIEHHNRTVFPNYNEIGVYFLFVDGAYTDNKVLGIAYHNTSMCIFGKTIHENSGGLGETSRTKLTSVVLEHEFGHILGLVNIGSGMVTPHADQAGGHCSNQDCLMYYAVETTDILGFLLTGKTPELDVNCLNDLKANGGK